MKFDFKLFPGIRLLIIAFIAAIIAYFFNFNYIVLTVLLCFSVINLFFRKLKTISYYFTIFCLGVWFVFHINKINSQIPNKIYQEFPAVIQGNIVNILKINNRQAKVIVEGDFDGKPIPTFFNQKFLLTVYGLNYKPIKLETGMHIFAKVSARTPRIPQLPTDFPEKNYSASLDVKWIASASAKNVAITRPPEGFSHIMESQVHSIQKRIEILFSKSSSPIITALLTGDKTKISYDTKQLFSLSGTAHILAVSGLHVGIISTIIFFLLGFVRNQWIKFIIFSLLLGGFIIFSGMQPSALRAGLMAILIVYAKSLQRHINPLNIVAIAITLILLVYPEMLFSVGFQMSVSAILGISLMMKPINNFFRLFIKSENYLINFIISSLTITFSASIIVTPLVAHYFKVFSIISPLANLLVIPLITLGMCFSILAVLFSYICIPIANLYALSASLMVELSQSINKWAIELPSAYLTGDTLVLPAILISLAFIYLIFSKNLKHVFYRLSISSLIIILGLSFLNTKTTDKLNIYPREQYVVIDFPLKNNMKQIFLIDRKPSQKPKYDIGMINYLKNISQPMIIFYSGNAGLSIVDKLKFSQNIKYFEIDINFQKRIQNLLKLKEPIPKIISINNYDK